MQRPSSRGMPGMAAPMALHELQNGQELPAAIPSSGLQGDDLFDYMLSGLPAAWSDLSEAAESVQYASCEQSSLLASRLRQHHQIGGDGSLEGKQMMLKLDHRSLMLTGMGGSAAASGDSDGSSGLFPLPLPLGVGGRSVDSEGPFESPNSNGSSMTPQTYGGAQTQAAGVSQSPAVNASGSALAGGGTAPPRQRVRARRGQATDPHSIAERLRRERIAERMKALQELVPNACKTDKASMLDEIIDHVKFLQLQVKVLSMSRLGGGAAAPLVADTSSESESRIGGRSGANGGAGGGGGGDSLTATEHQVAKLMQEDMGSAMQYLRGKGLCLMPVSLASAISSTTCCHPRALPLQSDALNHAVASAARPSPRPQTQSSSSVSVLTVQSTMVNGHAGDTKLSRTSGSKGGLSEQLI